MKKDDSLYRIELFSNCLRSLMQGENPYGKIVTVQELADGIGMTRQAITKYLNIGTDNSNIAVPSIVVLSKISDFFGVTPNYLLGYSSNIKEDINLKIQLDLLKELGIDFETYKKFSYLNSLSNKEKQIIKRMINSSIDGMLNTIK